MSKKKKSKSTLTYTRIAPPSKDTIQLSELVIPSECFLLFKENIQPMFGIIISADSPYQDRVIGLKYDITAECRGKQYDVLYKVANPSVGYFNANERVIADNFNIINIDIHELGKTCESVTLFPNSTGTQYLSEIRFKDFNMQEYNCNLTIDTSDEIVCIDINYDFNDFKYSDLGFNSKSVEYGLDSISIMF